MKTLSVAFATALVSSVVSITLVGQAQPARTPASMAYVSGSRIMTESFRGRSESARLQGAQQEKNADLRAKQQALVATRQQLSTAGGADRARLLPQEQQQRTELEQATLQAQQELQGLQRDVANDIQTRVKAAVAELMKTEHYQVVLNQDTSIVWAVPELDITPAVVKKMNEQK